VLPVLLLKKNCACVTHESLPRNSTRGSAGDFK